MNNTNVESEIIKNTHVESEIINNTRIKSRRRTEGTELSNTADYLI